MPIGSDFPVFKLTKDIAISNIGGFLVRYINDTGANSIKGTVVISSLSVEDAVDTMVADNDEAIGVIYNSGIADGSDVWVAVSGKADVLIQDGQIATIGYWVRGSITQAGRADITNADPPGGGIPQADIHFRELGHCLQTKSSGTDVLARCNLHFN